MEATRKHAPCLRPSPTANPTTATSTTVKDPPFASVTTRQGPLDLMEALRLLGIARPNVVNSASTSYKVGMVWARSARRDALRFVREKAARCWSFEEKRGIIESPVQGIFLIDWPGDKPARMVGNARREWRAASCRGQAEPLTAPLGAHRPARRLDGISGPGVGRTGRSAPGARTPSRSVSGLPRRPISAPAARTSTSTKVPRW